MAWQWTFLVHLTYTIIGLTVFTLILGWWKNGYFRRRGVKSPPAYLPFIGNMTSTLTRQQHFNDFVLDVYKFHPEERYVGIIQFAKPVIVVRDIELVKQVTIKDFDHFVDRVSSFEENVDLVFSNSLFSLRGQKWRDMRATLSPAFTSSKMRGMFQFIVDCGEQMTDYYMKQMKVPENKVRGLVEVEMKDAFTRYTNDVIATTAFGLEVNSFIEKNNQFYLMGKEASDFTGLKIFKFFFLLALPRLSKVLDIRFFSKKLSDFYRSLVWDTIKDREDRNVVRNDMLQLLMEAKKGTLKHDSNDDGKEAGFAAVEESSIGKTTVQREWSDDEILAQAVLFFIAGFETSSTLLCFIAHELALNPNVQKRLQEEIDKVSANLEGKLTYDCLQKMKYLDMVVSETLRKWPPVSGIDRKCIKSYMLPPPNDKSDKGFQMTEHDAVFVPIYGFHHDPKYFPKPELFDPERFSDENKHNIKPFTYMPFGVGPRNCIGSRFALMEAKAVIYNMLLRFDIVTTAKTENSIKLDYSSFNLSSKNGFWVGFKPRML